MERIIKNIVEKLCLIFNRPNTDTDLRKGIFYYVTKSLSNIYLDKDGPLDERIIYEFATDDEAPVILKLKSDYPFLANISKQFIEVDYNMKKFREKIINNDTPLLFEDVVRKEYNIEIK